MARSNSSHAHVHDSTDRTMKLRIPTLIYMKLFKLLTFTDKNSPPPSLRKSRYRSGCLPYAIRTVLHLVGLPDVVLGVWDAAPITACRMELLVCIVSAFPGYC